MRILHIMGSADVGGIASVVYNYMSFINREKYHFDIAVNAAKKGRLETEMEKMGATFYRLPKRSQGLKEYSKSLIELLDDNSFDVIHVHSNSSSFIDLRIAKKKGICCRIAHSHTALKPNSLNSLLRQLAGQCFNYYYATKIISCGKVAGDIVFGKKHMKSSKALVLPNAIPIRCFQYDQDKRSGIRKEWGLDNQYIIGMVGSFTYLKNHIFAIEMFNALQKQCNDIKLIFVGDGELKGEIEDYCDRNNITDKVRFLGIRSDMERIYQGLDMLIMPSISEGFPVAGIEAITSGLPVLLSDRITDELKFGSHVTYLPLKKEMWIQKLQEKPINGNRILGYKEAKENGFDIYDAVHMLEKVYDEGTYD